MIENLIAYEMAGQRRCIHAPAGWKHHVGSADSCHIQFSGEGVPNVLFSFVRDGAGGVTLLDETGAVMQKTTLPLETEVMGMSLVMFEPGDLLQPPHVVNAAEDRALVLRCSDLAAMLEAPAGTLLCAGCAPDADLVLPEGPNYAYALWWDGAEEVNIAVLDSSEGGAWATGEAWGEDEVVRLPVVLLAGSTTCELGWVGTSSAEPASEYVEEEYSTVPAEEESLDLAPTVRSGGKFPFPRMPERPPSVSAM